MQAIESLRPISSESHFSSGTKHRHMCLFEAARLLDCNWNCSNSEPRLAGRFLVQDLIVKSTPES